MDTLDAVLDLAKRGFRVHPLQIKNKIPLLTSWEKRASTDESTIRMWASQYKDCNWGIATGKGSDVIVIDIDPQHGGDLNWRKLISEHGEVETVSVKTGSGGVHLYFKYPENIDIGNRSGINGKGIDVRGNNGQVVAPFSIHPNGNMYVWINSPDEYDVADIPDWLLELIESNVESDFTPVGAKMDRGNRNNSVYHAALALARQGTTEEFAIDVVRKWVRDQGFIDMPDIELLATIDSAYKAASKRTLDISERSDTFNAEVLIENYGSDLIYIPGMGWFHWNEKVWEPDSDNAITSQLFMKCMKALREESSQKMATVSSKHEAKELAATIQWTIKSLSASSINAAVSLAGTFSSVRKRVDEIDSPVSSMLLNCNNGTIDLQTGQLRKHNKSDMITKMVPIDFDPNAVCPFWESTFELIFSGNKHLIDFMHRALGYSITGLTDERCFFICWGESGANGKSTILETIQGILGAGYSQMSDMVVITSTTVDNRVSSSLAKLQGSRFVSMNEAEEHQKLSEALIKQLTGGDTVQACFKYKNPFEYVPKFKLWIRTNEKPVVRSQTNSIWDRIKLIPFERSIPKEQRLPRSEVDARLDAEKQGILTWLVEGARRWTEEKTLNDPQEISAAVQGYRTDSDIVKMFMEECTEEGKTFKVKSSDLYQAFVGWSRDAGERYIMTRTKFVQRCAAIIGVPVTRSGGNTYIMGIKVNQQASMYVA
jgi:putative DNA primase/helicase